MRLAEKVLEKQPYAFAYGLLFGSAIGAISAVLAVLLVVATK